MNNDAILCCHFINPMSVVPYHNNNITEDNLRQLKSDLKRFPCSSGNNNCSSLAPLRLLPLLSFLVHNRLLPFSRLIIGHHNFAKERLVYWVNQPVGEELHPVALHISLNSEFTAILSPFRIWSAHWNDRCLAGRWWWWGKGDGAWFVTVKIYNRRI